MIIVVNNIPRYVIIRKSIRKLPTTTTIANNYNNHPSMGSDEILKQMTVNVFPMMTLQAVLLLAVIYLRFSLVLMVL